MSAIVNARDVLLQSASPRLEVVATNVAGYLTADTFVAPASSVGVVSSFTGCGGTFKVFDGTTDVTTSCTFAILSNPDTLTASIGASTGVYAVTAAGSWANGSRVTFLTLRATYAGVTVDKVFTLTKANAGTNGSNGTNGADGSRGTVNIAATTTGTTWSNTEANAALAAAGYGSPQSRDIVTLYNSGASYSEARFYSVGSWLALTAYVNGNMLVSGTLSADVIDGGTITGSSMYLAGGNFQVNASTGGVIAYDFVGANSEFDNTPNPSLPCLTSTCYSGVGFTSQPAIKAIASPSGYAIEATGQIYASGGFVGNATSATTAATATTATIATSASEVSNASNAKMKASSGAYSAWMQTDGNFVVYHGATPYWDAATDLSDARMKDDIVATVQTGLDTVNALRVVDFKWNADSPFDDTSSTQTGFIAQEVLEIVPKAVKEIAGTLLLHKEELVPFLVKAVQELYAQVQELQTRVTTLENQ